MSRCCLLVASLLFATHSSAAEAHMIVELREASGFSLDGVEVRLIRLNDGSPGEELSGTDRVVPYGTYRVEASFGDGFWRYSTVVSVRQPEVRVRIGLDFRSCCLSSHADRADFRGEVRGKLSGFDDPSRYTVSIMPIWSNAYNISTKLDAAGEFQFFPVDLGLYVVLLMERDRVLETRIVNLTEYNAVARPEFRLSEVGQQP